MEEAFIIQKSNSHTAIPNKMLRDERLTFGARGVMALILSMPDDWEIDEKIIRALSPNKESQIFAYLAELRKFGYLSIEGV